MDPFDLLIQVAAHLRSTAEGLWLSPELARKDARELLDKVEDTLAELQADEEPQEPKPKD